MKLDGGSSSCLLLTLLESDAHASAKKTKRTGADERLRAAMKCALDALLAAELSVRDCRQNKDVPQLNSPELYARSSEP